MDSKKFLQLVEEKKKNALEKKQARLEWEQRLEAAAKAKAEAKARQREEEKACRKHEKRTFSESSDKTDVDRKVRRKHKRKISASDSSDESDAQRKAHRKHKRRSSASDFSDFKSDDEGRSEKIYRKKHKRKNSSHESSEDSQEVDTQKTVHRKKHKKSLSDSDCSDYVDAGNKLEKCHRKYTRTSDLDSSYEGDLERESRKKRHHGRKHRKHSRKSRREAEYKAGNSDKDHKIFSSEYFERKQTYKHLKGHPGHEKHVTAHLEGQRVTNSGREVEYKESSLDVEHKVLNGKHLQRKQAHKESKGHTGHEKHASAHLED